jgi:hypothetical protein
MHFEWDGDFWRSRCLVPALEAELPVVIIPEREDGPTPRQLEVAEAVAALPATVVPDMHDHLWRYYQETATYVSEEDLGCSLSSAKEVAGHYTITEIVVPRLGESKHAFLFITGECEWEVEHGFELLLRDGKVIKCEMAADCLFLNEEWDSYIAPTTPAKPFQNEQRPWWKRLFGS